MGGISKNSFGTYSSSLLPGFGTPFLEYSWPEQDFKNPLVPTDDSFASNFENGENDPTKRKGKLTSQSAIPFIFGTLTSEEPTDWFLPTLVLGLVALLLTLNKGKSSRQKITPGSRNFKKDFVGKIENILKNEKLVKDLSVPDKAILGGAVALLAFSIATIRDTQGVVASISTDANTLPTIRNKSADEKWTDLLNDISNHSSEMPKIIDLICKQHSTLSPVNKIKKMIKKFDRNKFDIEFNDIERKLEIFFTDIKNAIEILLRENHSNVYIVYKKIAKKLEDKARATTPPSVSSPANVTSIARYREGLITDDEEDDINNDDDSKDERTLFPVETMAFSAHHTNSFSKQLPWQLFFAPAQLRWSQIKLKSLQFFKSKNGLSRLGSLFRRA